MHQKGIHHITAVAGNPRVNHDFYAGKLGLRLVKKTVNFDDPSVYHLYYGDETGTPGSILTFFPWSHLQNGKPDRGQVVAVAFAIPPSSLDFWNKYLQDRGIEATDPFVRFEKKVIGFQDPDGLHLEIVTDPGVDKLSGWSGGPVPAEHSIRGLHGATLAEQE
ncbi:MAG: VOC family protein, partial [Balneolaceae bacterium]|nr:VOC family protein [Balneolaceae bacterium]